MRLIQSKKAGLVVLYRFSTKAVCPRVASKQECTLWRIHRKFGAFSTQPRIFVVEELASFMKTIGLARGAGNSENRHENENRGIRVCLFEFFGCPSVIAMVTNRRTGTENQNAPTLPSKRVAQRPAIAMRVTNRATTTAIATTHEGRIIPL